MKTTISESDFFAAFRAYGRENQFSCDALRLLFKYLEEYEESTGEELELDVIGVCCEYTEQTPAEIAAEYDIETVDEDGDEIEDAVLDYLNYHTSVVGETSEGTIVYASF